MRISVLIRAGWLRPMRCCLLGGGSGFPVAISHAVFGEDLSDCVDLGYVDGSVVEAGDVPLQERGGESKVLDFVLGG